MLIYTLILKTHVYKSAKYTTSTTLPAPSATTITTTSACSCNVCNLLNHKASRITMAGIATFVIPLKAAVTVIKTLLIDSWDTAEKRLSFPFM